MTVGWIMATRDRHRCVERVLRCFIDQDYDGDMVLWIHNNSPHPFKVDYPALPKNKKIIVYHSPNDSSTNQPYENVGYIYNDLIRIIPIIEASVGYSLDIITWTEDDDLYLPNHTTEGVNGIKRAIKEEKKSYKPYHSWFRTPHNTQLAHNVFEPSIFTLASYIREAKFKNTSMDYHFGWLQPLIDNDEILIDKAGIPTLIYDWSSEIPVYKLSGSGSNELENYIAYKTFSKSEKGVLTPISEEKAKEYYNLVSYERA